MNKQTFNQTLRQYLSSLPEADIDKSLTYFNEMIDDRLDEGMSEEEAVADLGDVRLIADSILAEERTLIDQVKRQFLPKEGLLSWQKILLILGAPLWLSIVLAVIAFCFALFLLYLAFWMVSGAFVLSGILVVVFSLFKLLGNIYEGLLSAGLGFCFLGFGCLLLFTMTRFHPRVRNLFLTLRKRGLR